MSQIFEYQLKIREHHIDTMGHVNNAMYLTLFEEARWELITTRGFGIEQIRQTHTGPVILEVNLKFMREIRLREQILITTQMTSYEGKIGKLEQKMIKEDGSVASHAIFTAGLMDLKTRKLVDPSPIWKNAIGL